MPLPGWSTVAGVAAKIIDRLSDPVKRAERRMTSIQEEMDALTKQPSTESNRRKFDSLVDELARLRKSKNIESK